MTSAQRLAVIITALPLERKAVVAHLRNVTEEPPVDGSIYRRGVFDERSDLWDVVVAEIGAGNVGAAAEAVRVITHYSPQVAIFVGVAGAIKDLKHGDVVASTKVYGYESGKDEQGGFETRPAVQLTTYRLEQRARYEVGEESWRLRIKGPSEPGVVPNASVAPIAAGEKVVASNRSRTYKFLRQHYGDAVAVEMEGHGFLLGVHMSEPTQGIVVRGISDRISDKNPDMDRDWQPVAARHAAAFAFQILAKLTGTVGGEQSSLTARMDDEWQRQHLEDARQTAGPRYASELSVETPLHDVFEALCATDVWFESLRPRGRKLCKAIRHWSQTVETTDSRGWRAQFPEHLREAGRAVAESLHAVGNSFTYLSGRKEGASLAAVATAASAMLPQMRELHAALRQDLEARHGKGTADSANFRQFEAEYQAAFPAANVDAARDMVALLEEIEAWGASGAGRAASARGVLLAGAAGAGKTHAICDIAHNRARRGLRTIVLFGEHFKSADEPWDRVRQMLGFGPLAREELLAALDAAGEASGGPLLLCIDGLNETRPRTYWRDSLSAFAVQATRHRHVRLCVSCRSTYERLIVPEGHALVRVEHVGFAGMENTACRAFFEYHGLESPVAPSFHPEFSNPLFLRLACETLKATGQRRMPTGWRGINTALRAFVREKNKAFAREYERDERERVPQRAMDEFMTEVERVRRVYLRWGDANAAVNRAQPAGLLGPSVLDWLVREGLLIADADPNDCGADADDVVRVAFERLGEHLFAARLLGNVQKGGLTEAIESGELAFSFADGEAVIANRGLVEALSIQVPEHSDFGGELLDALARGGPRDRVLAATVAALPWRDPGHMTARTREIIRDALTTREIGHDTFDNLLSIACQETAPDATWLHGLLRRQSMRERDGFLCGYLHDRIGVSSAVERLLCAPFEVETSAVPEPVLLRWATILLWFCIAADRRARDRATKGLVAITQSHPLVWATLIQQFSSVNDEYVVERCLCSAYGTLLRTRDADAERAVAAAAHEAVFAYPLTFQNALIRDHARCIIELAALDGVLPLGIDLATVRPPYRSEWPLAIPSEEEIDRYQDARRDYPHLYTSCLHDDFFTYLLSRLEAYEHALSRRAMGRWVLHHVIETMGYGGEVLAGYDGVMIHRYGGGRGRPVWAERIGKKYQWIALKRLAARLADHVEPKKDDWEPKATGTPLVYASGRDIDPSLLADGQLPDRKGAVWWQSERYDFAAVLGAPDTEWVARRDDLPSSERLLQPVDRDGTRWQLLEGYPKWDDRADDVDEDFTTYRQIWTQVRGYVVDDAVADAAFSWMSGKNFMGRWMPEGASFHEGYVGEYPWGILFTMYPDSWHGSGSGEEKCPARLTPACNSLASNYGEDAFQQGSIVIHVPARDFFDEEHLRWDGLGGYRAADGRLRFLDPSLTESGPAALLVDREYLLGYLRRKRLALVWTVLGEKLLIGHGAGAPRLQFSRAHILDQDGRLRSSDLFWEAT